MRRGWSQLSALLNAGLPRDSHDARSGNSLLHDAVTEDAPDCVAGLLLLGVDSEVRDQNFSRTARELAHALKRTACTAMFERAASIGAIASGFCNETRGPVRDAVVTALCDLPDRDLRRVEVAWPILHRMLELERINQEPANSGERPRMFELLVAWARRINDHEATHLGSICRGLETSGQIAATLQRFDLRRNLSLWPALDEVFSGANYNVARGELRLMMINTADCLMRRYRGTCLDGLRSYSKLRAMEYFAPQEAWSVMYDLVLMQASGHDPQKLVDWANDDTNLIQVRGLNIGKKKTLQRAIAIEAACRRFRNLPPRLVPSLAPQTASTTPAAEGSVAPPQGPAAVDTAPEPIRQAEPHVIESAVLADIAYADLNLDLLAALTEAFSVTEYLDRLREPDLAARYARLLVFVVGAEVATELTASGGHQRRKLLLLIAKRHPDKVADPIKYTDAERRCANALTAMLNAIKALAEDGFHMTALKNALGENR